MSKYEVKGGRIGANPAELEHVMAGPLAQPNRSLAILYQRIKILAKSRVELFEVPSGAASMVGLVVDRGLLPGVQEVIASQEMGAMRVALDENERAPLSGDFELPAFSPPEQAGLRLFGLLRQITEYESAIEAGLVTGLSMALFGDNVHPIDPESVHSWVKSRKDEVDRMRESGAMEMSAGDVGNLIRQMAFGKLQSSL